MIVDMINNKKLNSVVTELFIYIKVTKDVRLNSAPFLIMTTPNK